MALRAEPWIEAFGVAGDRSRPRRLFRSSARDASPLLASLFQGALLVGALWFLAPSSIAGAVATALFIAVGMAWGSNTVSHIHLHTPLFRSRSMNRAFGFFLTASLGIPQTIWRRRHLWHHAGEPVETRRRPWTATVWAELCVVAAVMITVALCAPRVFVLVYLPGYLLGLGLCRIQGDMEHAATGDPNVGVSFYGRLHNLLWFNDGYHAEHHLFPTEHWSRLPARRAEIDAVQSALPPLWRPLELLAQASNRHASRWVASFLCALERLALASGLIQRFMVATHLAAFKRVVGGLPSAPRRITIVGGGLFPRSALVLARVFPLARLRVVDRSAASIAKACRYLDSVESPPQLSFERAEFDPELHGSDDLVVVPLAFVGESRLKRAVARRTALLTHDWLWSQRPGTSAIVSWLLLKSVTLSVPDAEPAE